MTTWWYFWWCWFRRWFLFGIYSVEKREKLKKEVKFFINYSGLYVFSKVA
jgi:hypothetical protein